MHIDANTGFYRLRTLSLLPILRRVRFVSPPPQGVSLGAISDYVATRLPTSTGVIWIDRLALLRVNQVAIHSWFEEVTR